MNERDPQQHARRLEKLARYIRKHGFVCKVEEKKLFCRTELTRADSPGKLFFKWEEVDANPEAVRLWLGY